MPHGNIDHTQVASEIGPTAIRMGDVVIQVS